MRKKVIGIIFAIFLILPCFFLMACSEPKETKLFVSVKSESQIFDNFKSDKFNFNYGDMNVYNISLNDFKIMVKFDDGSVKVLSSNDENLKLEYLLEVSDEPAPIGEYLLTISYKELTKTYDVVVSEIKVAKPSLISNNFVYDGLTKHPAIINYNFNGTNSGIVASGDLFGVNAGEYLITFSLKDGYKWSDGTTSPVSISWNIAKREITQEKIDSLGFKIFGETGFDITYDGETKTLVTTESLPDYLVLTGETSALMVGNYIAEIEIKENYLNNYEFVDGVNTEISWKISKIKIDIPKLNNLEIDYYEGMSIDKLSLFDSITSGYEDWKNSVLVLSTGFNNPITSVGNYTFNFRIMDKAHYSWIDNSTDDLSLIFKVNPIDFDMAWYNEVVEIETIYNANKTLSELESVLKTKISEVYIEENIYVNNFEFKNSEMLVGDIGSKLVNAVYLHNGNYNEMEFDVRINVIPYEINLENISLFVDENCLIPFQNSFVYNSLEQCIYANFDATLLNTMRAEVGENFELEFEYGTNCINAATNVGEYNVSVTANIKENSNIKATNYKILDMKTPKTWEITKAVFNPNNSNFIDWSEVDLVNGNYKVSYSGEIVNVNLPKINYTEILGVDTNEDSGINISVSYYQNDSEVSPIDAGTYEVRFIFSVLKNSNYSIENNNYISKELIIEKAVTNNFELESMSIYLGEKLKDKEFNIIAKDLNGNIIENPSYKFKNSIDGEKIPTVDGKVTVELVHDNFIGEVEVSYEIIDLFDKIIVRDKINSNIYSEISGKDFYELNIFNLDKFYELYFKSGYDFKIYDNNDEEIAGNSLDFAESEISNFKIKNETNNIILSMPNCIIGTNVYSGVTYYGNLSETVAITSIGETSVKEIYDIKYYSKGTVLENSEILSNMVSWDNNDYLLSYEVSSETKSVKIELDNVFTPSNSLSVKLYNKDNQEIENCIDSNVFEINPKEVSRVVVTYLYGTESTPRTALDLIIVDNTMISEVVVTKLLFNGESIEGKLERSALTDYIFNSNSGIISNINVTLKDEFKFLGYTTKLVTENGTAFDCFSQENNCLLYIEIYNGTELLERRSLKIIYEFEFETIENGILEIDSNNFYYSVTLSNGLKLFINSNGVYDIICGELVLKEAYFDFDEKFVFYNFDTSIYSSIQDDETGEFNIVNDTILSKNSINIYGGDCYEVFDENYNKTNMFASLDNGLLRIYELVYFDKDSSYEYLTYYFVSDRVILGDNTYTYIYVENNLGYMANLYEGENELEIKIPVADKSQNTYFIKEKLIIELK